MLNALFGLSLHFMKLSVSCSTYIWQIKIRPVTCRPNLGYPTPICSSCAHKVRDTILHLDTIHKYLHGLPSYYLQCLRKDPYQVNYVKEWVEKWKKKYKYIALLFMIYSACHLSITRVWFSTVDMPSASTTPLYQLFPISIHIKVLYIPIWYITHGLITT